MHKNKTRTKRAGDLRFIACVSIFAFFLCAGALEYINGSSSEKPSTKHAFNISHSLPAFLVPDVEVSQGDRIYIMNEEDNSHANACTVGYVDPSTRVIQTAGHCFNDGKEVYTENWELIGAGSKSNEKDTGYIQPRDNVKLVENAYSTDKVDSDGVKIGDRVCVYGASSEKIRCDVMTDTGSASTINTGVNNAGIRGDSGGPAWTDDGYIGTYSGSRKDADTDEILGGYVTIS